MTLSPSGFNGDIRAVGEDTLEIDKERPDLTWKWSIVAHAPGTYNLIVVAESLDPNNQIYLQDLKSAIHVDVYSTSGYVGTKINRWIGEAVTNIEDNVVSVKSALGAVVAISAITGWRRKRNKRSWLRRKLGRFRTGPGRKKLINAVLSEGGPDRDPAVKLPDLVIPSCRQCGAGFRTRDGEIGCWCGRYIPTEAILVPPG